MKQKKMPKHLERKCVECGTEEDLTRDHIIPKFLYKGFPHRQIGFKKVPKSKNYQWLCHHHNLQKGNKIDVKTEIGEEFWTLVRDEINRQLAKKYKANTTPTCEEEENGSLSSQT